MKPLYSLSLQMICFVILHLESNGTGETGQGSENETSGKLYWNRERDDFNESISKEHSVKLNSAALKKKTTEGLLSSGNAFDILRNMEYLNQQVNEIQKTCNSSQLQTQVRHLTVAIISVQV